MPSHHRPFRCFSSRLCAIASLSIATFSHGGPAVEPKNPGAPVSEASPWDVTGALGLGLASGNTDTLNLSAQFLATYLTLEDEFYFGTDYLRTENDDVVTGHSLHSFAAYNHTLTGPLYAGVLGDFWYDEIADLDYRFNLSPTLGFYVVKNDSTLLALEGGVGYQWEKQGAVQADYFTARFGQRFSHKFANGVVVTQSVGWVTELEDFSENWLLAADISLKVPLSTHWAVGATVRYTYDNTPAAGRDEGDLVVLATLSYSLRGFEPEAAAGRRSLKPDKAKPAALAKGWSNTAAAGLALTRGNSDTLLFSVDYASAFRGDEHEIFLNAGGGYGEIDSNTTAENVRASAQYNRLLTDLVFAGVGASYLYDDIAEVNYRVSPFASLGVYVVKSDNVSLSLEAGPSYVWEEVGGVAADYMAVQAAEKLTIAFSDTVSLNHALVYSAELEDFNNYTLTGSASLDVDFTENLSFRTGLSVVYDSTPAAGLDSTDTVLSAGIAVRF